MGGRSEPEQLVRIGTKEFDVLVQQALENSLLNIDCAVRGGLTFVESAFSKTNALFSLSEDGAKSIAANMLRALDLSPARASLSVACIVQQMPPALVRHHWSAISRKILSAIKVVENTTDRASFLIALAVMIAVAKSYESTADSLHSSVSTVSDSATVHALNTVQQSVPVVVKTGAYATPDIVRLYLSALAVLHAAVSVTPNQVRPRLAAVENALWTNCVTFPQSEVRLHASTLLAALPRCYSPKIRDTAFTSLFDRILSEINGIRDSFSRFERSGLSTAPSIRYAHESPRSLVDLFTSLRVVVQAYLEVQGVATIKFPLGKFVAAITSVLQYKTVDPYASAAGAVDLPLFCTILQLIRIESLRLCACVAINVSRSALLPHATSLSSLVAGCFTSQRSPKANSPTPSTSPVGIVERTEAYRTASSLMTALGSPAIDALASPLVTALEGDLSCATMNNDVDAVLYSSINNDADKLKALPFHQPRPSKRRRHQRQNFNSQLENSELQKMNEEMSAHLECSNSESHSASTVKTRSAVTAGAICGLQACEVMLSSRSLPSVSRVEAIAQLEELLAPRLVPRGDLGCALVRVLSSLILSGGSGRPSGRASPLLHPSVAVLRRLVHKPSLSGQLAVEVRTALASCESLVHPSGPPFRPISGNIPERPLMKPVAETMSSVVDQANRSRDMSRSLESTTDSERATKRMEPIHTDASPSPSSNDKDMTENDSKPSVSSPSRRHECDHDTAFNSNPVDVISTVAEEQSSDMLSGASVKKYVNNESACFSDVDKANTDRSVVETNLDPSDVKVDNPEHIVKEIANELEGEPSITCQDDPQVLTKADAVIESKMLESPLPQLESVEHSGEGVNNLKKVQGGSVAVHDDEAEELDILNSLVFDGGPDKEDR